MNFEIHDIVNDIFNSITYILPTCIRNECWLVDCGDVDKVIERDWNILGVLLTHTHFDHIYGLNKLITYFPKAIIYTNETGMQSLQNPKWNISKYHEEIDNFIFEKPEIIRIVADGEILALKGGLEAKVLSTPGHDPSCLSFCIDNYLFTGDAYIPGTKTIAKFPRSNKEQALMSIEQLKVLENKGFRIMPGHWI